MVTRRDPTRKSYIESPANPRIRMLSDLQSAAGRKKHGAFLVEGTRLLFEAVATGWDLLVAVYDEERVKDEPGLASLLRKIPGALPASPAAVRAATDTVTPQGIVAAAVMPAAHPSVGVGDPLVLLLDGVADPGNAGTLLRSAVGAGVHTVLSARGSVDLFSPKVVRAGMGAHFQLRFGVDLAWPEIMDILGRERRLVVADAAADTPYHGFDWQLPTGLVVGSETHGPSREARNRAFATISIPLAPGLESLNAAVAGSVILFEAKRQRDLGG